MRTIKIPYEGKGYKVNYKVETIDLSNAGSDFLNVYSVFVDDDVLKNIIGEHYTILHNPAQNIVPSYYLTSSENIEESNLKKVIWQQILNNPSE